MSCQTTNYSITLGGSIADQDISFEVQGTITITFIAPTGYSITGVTSASDPNPLPSGYPPPTIGTNYITFSDPRGLVADFDVYVSYNPTTTIKFRPRTTCPT